MKEGQIDAADRDYQRRCMELEGVVGRADIVAEAVVLGVLYVEG